MEKIDSVPASNVTEVTSGSLPKVEARHMTMEAMQKDFDYLMAQKMTKALLDNGFISIEEFDLLSKNNRSTFSPYLAELLE